MGGRPRTSLASSPSASEPAPSRLRHFVCRFVVRAHRWAMAVAGWIGPRTARPPDPRGLHLLLTGTIHSDNWIRAHVSPLAAARGCRLVTMVTNTRFQESERVRAVYPPRWLARCVGATGARSLVFLWLALRERPDFVGGFHMLING